MLCWSFFEPRRRGEAIFSSVLCFSEVGRFRPFRDAPRSSECSTASMRLQLMLQQPAKRIVVSRFLRPVCASDYLSLAFVTAYVLSIDI